MEEKAERDTETIALEFITVYKKFKDRRRIRKEKEEAEPSALKLKRSKERKRR